MSDSEAPFISSLLPPGPQINEFNLSRADMSKSCGTPEDPTLAIDHTT
jgi:hypothetical protein